MKVTYNWLKDFVEIRILPQALAEKLTMVGLEVTSLEKKDGDFVFGFEITSNRTDCLSVIGIAREVAAITNSKLKLPQATGFKPQAKSLQRAACSAQSIFIKIENKKDCPLYIARVIRDVKVGPSPAWLKKRLELIGCRSVNNIVDITNYILFERGEPLHAFDLDKLAPEEIIVHRAKNNEKITTIDGERRTLNSDILVIADKEKPVAIAGVMGSRDTEVTYSTKNILLEAAIFNPTLIRRTRQILGLQSESAYRFERGIDLEIVERSSWQAADLISEIAGGKIVLATKSPSRIKRKKKIIYLNTLAVSKILSIDIPATTLKGILSNLGFNVRAKTKDNFAVGIPSFRQDVNSAIDLIEEVARISGYKKIPTSSPSLKPQVTAYTTRNLVSLIKNILAGLGLSEVITYGLMDKGSLKESDFSPIEILNPLSKEQEILRPTLTFGLARCIAYNLNQKQEQINIFEVAKVFSGTKNQPKEELALGIALCGIKDLTGPLHLKGILEVVFRRLGIKDYRFTPLEKNHSIRKDSLTGFSMADVQRIAIYLGQEKIGILDKFNIKNNAAWIAEISLERLSSFVDLKKRFSPLPIYPGISRDISLILKEEIPAQDILEAIKGKDRPLLREVKIVDYYKGKQIPKGHKGLTISCLYRSDERTLTEAEINPLHSGIASLLREKFAAQIRA